MQNEIDTFNKYMVGSQGANIVILNPPCTPMSKADALMLAAWIVALSTCDDSEFQKVLEAVRST